MKRRNRWLLNRLVTTRFWWMRALLLRWCSWLSGDEANEALCGLRKECEGGGEWNNVHVVEQIRATVIRSRRIGVASAIAEARAVSSLVPVMVENAAASMITRGGDHGVTAVRGAVNLLREAAAIAVPPHPTRPVVLSSLGYALLTRYEIDGRCRDLHESTVVLDEAYKTVGLDPDDRCAVSVNYANALLALAAAGEGDQHERADELLTEVMPLAEGPTLAKVWSGLGQVALERFFRECTDGARREQADEAVACFEQALDYSGNDGDLRAQQLNNLGIALAERFLVAGATEDLQRAVAMHRESVVNREDGSFEEHTARVNLATALIERYGALGHTSDLDESCTVLSDVLASADPRSADYPAWQANLALALQIRFEHTGELAVLDTAVELLEMAVASEGTPAVHAARTDQLAVMLRERSTRRGDEPEMHRSIALHLQAADAPDLPVASQVAVFGNLGGSLRALAGMTGLERHRREAVAAYRKALDVGPEHGVVRAGLLANLALGLQDVYDHSHERTELAEALALHREALCHTPSSSPFRALRVYHLAGALRRGCVDGVRLADVNQTAEAYREACRLGSESAVEIALRAGVAWMEWAEGRGEWDEVLEADGYVLMSTKDLLRRQVSRTDKATWLRLVAEASALAARALVEREDIRAAADRLEWGRGRLLSEELVDADRLLAAMDETRPELAARYREAAEKMRGLDVAAAWLPLGRTSFGMKPSS